MHSPPFNSSLLTAMERWLSGQNLPFISAAVNARQEDRPVIYNMQDCLNEDALVETPQTSLLRTTFAGVRNLQNQEEENRDHVPMTTTDVHLGMSNDRVQSTLCLEQPNKRVRGSNWTREETDFLVKCKKDSVHDRGSRRYGTSWEGISEKFQGKFGNICGVKSSKQCRLRWDTLIKSYRKIKEYCAGYLKECSQLTKDELRGLNLDTSLEYHWFKIIDEVCPPRSRTRSGQPGQLADEGPSNLPRSMRFDTGHLADEGPSSLPHSMRFGSGQLPPPPSIPDEAPPNLLQSMRSVSGQLLPSSIPDEAPPNLLQSMRAGSGQLLPSYMHDEAPPNLLQSMRAGSGQLLPSSIPDEAPSNLPQSIRAGSGQLLPSSWPDEAPSNLPQSVRTGSGQLLPLSIPDEVPSDLPQSMRAGSGQLLPSSMPDEAPSNLLQSMRAGSGQLLPSSMSDEASSYLPQISRPDQGQLLSSTIADEGPANLLPEATPAMSLLESPAPRRRRHKIRQRAVPGFNGLPELLKRILLDCILFKNSLSYYSIKEFARWLAVVHDADPEKMRLCLHKLKEHNLIEKDHEEYEGYEDYEGLVVLDTDSLRKYQDFALKAVRDNPKHDIHLNIRRDGRSIFENSNQHQGLRVLSFFKCVSMTEAQLSGLPNLRSLTFENCPSLKKVTGWEQLKRLGWLGMKQCDDLLPELESVTSLQTLEFRITKIPHMPVFGQCFLLLCKLIVSWSHCLVTTGNLGNLRCLQELEFCRCHRLASVHASLSELQFLTDLRIIDCKDLKTIPYVGRLKRLRRLSIRESGIESIPGIEEVESLVMLFCMGSQLSWLPDLDCLTGLRAIYIEDTPLHNNKVYSKYYNRAVRWIPEVLMTDVEDDITEGSVYATSTGDAYYYDSYPGSDDEVSECGSNSYGIQ